MKGRDLCYLLVFLWSNPAPAQNVSLKECFQIAKEKNIIINQTKASLLGREYNLAAEKQRYLPKIDALGSYTYLSRPLEINLQTVRQGVVEGSSKQAVNTANSIYQEITGNNLPQSAQDKIYNSSKTIIDGFYPDYNPQLSRQSYFIANLAVRQPVYLGNKLNTAKKFAQSEVVSGRINTQLAEKDVTYAIALQYLRILYLNSIIRTQSEIVVSFSKNAQYGEEMVKNEVMAPYQKSWTKVLLSQAQTASGNLELEKKNALIELNKLMGVDLETILVITDSLPYKKQMLEAAADQFWEDNASFRLAQSKIETARTSEQIARSASLPNVFAIGNYNLYQNDLPVTMAPWMVGLEMQWTIFNGTQTSKRRKAAGQFVEEVKLAEENTRESLKMQLIVAKNKIQEAENEIGTIDSARVEIGNTRRLVNERVQNQLSSLKDLNDVILMQAEVEKAYHTAILNYYIALETYWNITGEPERISEIIQ